MSDEGKHYAEKMGAGSMLRGLRRRACVWGIASGLLLTMASCGGSGGGGTSPPSTTDNPLPAVSSISPTSATVGAAAQTLTINGTNFLSTSTVTYNNVAHTATYVSATGLSISLSASDEATAGTYAVVVTNPAPGGGASNSVSFAVNNPLPAVNSISPTSALAGAAAQTLTINGTNFLSTSTVTYNNVARTATHVSATKLTISLSASDEATAGTYGVVVTNPGPGGGASNCANFTVNGAPTVSVKITSPSSSTASVAVGQTLSITASVTGTTNTAVIWTVSGAEAGTVVNGNSTLGVIPGTSTSATYTAPAAIPGGNNPVTITATSEADTAQSDSMLVTIDPSTVNPNVVNVPGNNSNATGIDLTLPSATPALGLVYVGVCTSPPPNMNCPSAGLAPISIAQNSTTLVWLLGQGLTQADGSAISGLNVTVSGASDVTVGPITSLLPSDNSDLLTNIAFQVTATANATPGPRNIIVTNSHTNGMQAYLGAIQIQSH